DWLQSLNQEVGPDECLSVFNQLLKKHFEQSMDQEVVKLISDLKKSGLVVGCLSNTENYMEPFHHRLQELVGFDFRILSYQAGLRKPDEKIYRLIFDFGSWKPEEVVFIDDKEENVVGAKKLGIEAVRFKNYQQLLKDLTVLRVTTS
ncbi:MAG: HAD-IA family hydrolase, partial [Patescibacteria group bacterium]